jgi:thiol:disulfide interchange protein DsbG
MEIKMLNKTKITTAVTFVLAGMVISGTASAATPYPSEEKLKELNSSLPSTFSRLISSNEKVVAKFDAGYGFEGYVIETPQQEAIIYHNEEKNISFSGMMLIDGGINVTEEHYETEIPAKDYSSVLAEVVQDNTVLTEGQADAEKELWVFFDPNCPYCHTIWETTRSFIDSGELKVHWMPVAFLSNTSAGKVAKFWQAEDQVAVFNEAEAKFNQGGSTPLRSSEITRETREMLEKNLDYMGDFGSNGTPTVIYETKEGGVKVISSSMSEERMRSFLDNEVK